MVFFYKVKAKDKPLVTERILLHITNKKGCLISFRQPFLFFIVD